MKASFGEASGASELNSEFVAKGVSLDGEMFRENVDFTVEIVKIGFNGSFRKVLFVVSFETEDGGVDRAVPGTATVGRGGRVTERGVDGHNVKFVAKISKISFCGSLGFFELGSARRNFGDVDGVFLGFTDSGFDV